MFLAVLRNAYLRIRGQRACVQGRQGARGKLTDRNYFPAGAARPRLLITPSKAETRENKLTDGDDEEDAVVGHCFYTRSGGARESSRVRVYSFLSAVFRGS